ncbi:MAG TPA: lysylphosphatidylglycerol synthase transmembrane domain-containing protein, partial [Acidimicrobiales bacterium]
MDDRPVAEGPEARPAAPPDQPPLVEMASESVPELLHAAEAGGADAPLPARGRRRWTLPLRIAISLLMLAVLYTRFPDFEWSEVVPDWNRTTVLWLSGAAALTLVGIVLSAVRWQQVLRAMGLHEQLRRLVPLYFAGQFVSNVLPTTIGGDVLRVSRLSRQDADADSADTFASVVLERLTGWLVLPLITFFGLIVNPDLRDQGRASTVAAVVAAATLFALATLLVIADHPRLGGRFAKSEGWTRFVGAVHRGVAQLRSHPAAAVGLVLAGLAYQLVLVAAALMVAAALGFGWLGLTPLLAFFPAVLIAQVLPIGISGLGIREGAFVLFLTPLGVPAEQAVALGLVLYVLNLVVSLAGAPAFA